MALGNLYRSEPLIEPSPSIFKRASEDQTGAGACPELVRIRLSGGQPGAVSSSGLLHPGSSSGVGEGPGLSGVGQGSALFSGGFHFRAPLAAQK